MLNQAAVHLSKLKKKAEEKNQQVELLKQKIGQMNKKIAYIFYLFLFKNKNKFLFRLIQSNLPSSSRTADINSQNNTSSVRSQIEQFFERYTKERSKQDYRFWLVNFF